MLKNMFGSIGIIGGADGPTKVFVSAPDTKTIVISAVIIAAIIVLLIVLIRRRRRK